MANVPGSAHAQQGRVYRIGYLHPTDEEDVAWNGFRRALKDLGYDVGTNTVLEARFAKGHVEELPKLAAELVSQNPDVIVAVSPTAIRAARASTKTIPIVMGFSGDDPVKSGFAATLARPGGNTTGLTTVALEIAPKWIELLRRVVPDMKLAAVLRSPVRQDHTDQVEALQVAAKEQGIRLYVAEARDADHYAEAFAGMTSAGSQGVVVLSGAEFVHDRARIVELANKHRLPSSYQYSEFVRAGGLVSYGPDIADLTSRAAFYVDKILKGANPAELPIERPRRFLLVLNRNTASALGLAIPPAMLYEANLVIG